MLIYNVTSNIDVSVHNDWLLWIKSHIPKVLATGYFTEAKLTRVLVENDVESVTYSVQYRAKSREALHTYYNNDASTLQKEATSRFGDSVLHFRTELEIVQEYTAT